jgi:peptidyl-prolyl cis-trans isomerase A (cyclophilin A)
MSQRRALIETPCGSLVVAVDLGAAPRTAAHFLEFVRRGHLETRSRIYRIVSKHNCDRAPAIEVVQFGWVPAEAGESPPLPPVPHEPTNETGLRHRHGTLSLARHGPGTGTCAFFLCIGDQPALDQDGARASDGVGFAAFGRVVEGWDVLAALHRMAGESEWLSEPLPIAGRLLPFADASSAPSGGCEHEPGD